jgi:hypothetical protein
MPIIIRTIAPATILFLNLFIVHPYIVLLLYTTFVAVHGTYLLLSLGGRHWWVTFIIHANKRRSGRHPYISFLCCNEIVVVCLTSRIDEVYTFKYGVIFSIFLVKLSGKN